MPRALRFQGSLPIEFWGECVLRVGYLINRTPSSVLKGKTPYAVLHAQSLSYTHLRIFGSLCFACNQNTKTNLQVTVVGVSSWGTLMGKKDGKSTILRPMNS